MTTAISRTRALGLAVGALGLVVAGLVIWLWLMSAADDSKAIEIHRNRAEINQLHRVQGRLAQAATVGRQDRARLLRLVQELQRQVHQLGGVPVGLPATPETAGSPQPRSSSGSSARPRPSSTPKPRPKPAPQPTAHPSPSPTPNPVPSICLLHHCV